MCQFVIRFIVILAITASYIQSPQAMELDPNAIFNCKLTADTEQPISQGTVLTFSITNISPQPVQLLPWYTPLEGFMGKLFIIADEQNNQLNYQGPMIKRMAPSQEDYLTITSGETITSTLNLQQVYDFQQAQYQLSMTTKYVQVIMNKQSYTIQVCKDAKLTINVIE